MRNHCQVVVLSFLQAGGRVTASNVLYRDLRMPRNLFGGPDLSGVGYVQKFADFGGTISEGHEGSFIATLPDGIRFEAKPAALLDTLGMLVERFVDEEYAWLDAAGRVVIDIGANVADSVVYFARRGAAYVYGYEPDPATFAAAQRNLELNRIRNADVAPLAVQRETGDGRTSFADVLDRACREHPGLAIVCKIDCEGCEYEIFAPGAATPPGVDRVSQIMIEYHWRSPEPLLAALEGMKFQVETSPGAPGVGWIRARRPR